MCLSLSVHSFRQDLPPPSAATFKGVVEAKISANYRQALAFFVLCIYQYLQKTLHKKRCGIYIDESILRKKEHIFVTFLHKIRGGAFITGRHLFYMSGYGAKTNISQNHLSEVSIPKVTGQVSMDKHLFLRSGRES